MKSFDALPTIIVLGRDWEHREGQNPLLSVEARVTCGALCTLLDMYKDAPANIIFSGGLTADDGTSEAVGLRAYFEKIRPDQSSVTIYEDSDCFDTKSSARTVRALQERTGITGESYLLGTKAHMKRAVKIFEQEGLDVVPVVAEPLYASRSAHAESFIHKYNRSPRNISYLVREAVLRGLLKVDPQNVVTDAMLRKTRKNRA